jgi:hypothetical protein
MLDASGNPWSLKLAGVETKRPRSTVRSSLACAASGPSGRAHAVHIPVPADLARRPSDAFGLGFAFVAVAVSIPLGIVHALNPPPLAIQWLVTAAATTAVLATGADDANSSGACWLEWHSQSPTVAGASIEAMIAWMGIRPLAGECGEPR